MLMNINEAANAFYDVNEQRTEDKRIGYILVNMEKIKTTDIDLILACQRRKKLPFGNTAIDLGLINEFDLERALSYQFDYQCLAPDSKKFSEELIAASQPFSKQTEMYRTIRSEIKSRWLTKERKEVCIVLDDNEPRSTSVFAANLAVVFAQLGERTLLIEANLRSISFKRFFNIASNRGLSDILASRADISCISQFSFFPGLSVLQAGTLPPNPQELIARPAFKTLILSITASYDVIIYNSPPISMSSDALILAAHAKAAILLGKKNSSELRRMKAIAEQLNRNEVTLLGSVMLEAN